MVIYNVYVLSKGLSVALISERKGYLDGLRREAVNGKSDISSFKAQ